MATANVNTQCSICPEKTSTFLCNGCSENFCFNHLTEHRQSLNAQLIRIQEDYKLFNKIIIDRKNNPEPQLLDCGQFSLIGGKKCPQSRIQGGETKMTAYWKMSAKQNRGGEKRNVRIMENIENR
jgi:hypothetical protein